MGDIHAAAYNTHEAAGFYEFVRTLEVYKTVIDKNTTVESLPRSPFVPIRGVSGIA